MKVRFIIVAVVLSLQGIIARAGDSPRSVTAVRVTTPPRVDGVLDDAVWKLAAPAGDFIQRDPHEGTPASERTEIRVLYDDKALYFGCMFYDSEPGGIVARLARRDDQPETDDASIRIDSFHDHQTGYEFTFSPAGVKVDILQFDDANKEDASWDPVWDLQTRVSPEGWCAEIRIPFDILRYNRMDSDTAENVWGINFLRDIIRKQESDRWAFTPKSQTGFISRYGHLLGLRNLPVPRQFEALPFVLGEQKYDAASPLMERREKFIGDAGLDLKYGVTSNFTIDATVNPDFGQVEADPAVLNLSTYETFYPEKRPFFVEGSPIFRFTTFGDGQFGPGMFYSRRIGRAISPDEVSVPVNGRIVDLRQHTAILGAAKLSGKTTGGLSVGVLEAFTGEESATVEDSLGNRTEQVVEPFAHYNVIRLKQDLPQNSNIGFIVTSVAKNSRRPALTNGWDWNLKFDDNTYNLTGFLAFSQTTTGSDDRISGSAGKIVYAKIGGEHWLWSWDVDFTSNHYNIDDIGFFLRPKDVGTFVSLNYKDDVPGDVVRNYLLGLSLHERRIFDGANIDRAVGLNGTVLFTNYWNVTANASYDGGLYDDRETRGYGLYRKPHTISAGAELLTDGRKPVIVHLSPELNFDDRSKREFGTQIGLTLRPVTWMEYSVSTGMKWVRNQEAWFENIDTLSPAANIFGDRSTDEYDLTVRGTVTFTRDLTLQVYSQVFLAKGHYANPRRLIGTSEFAPFAVSDNPDFNEQSFNMNVVLRWEYMSGSTLYLVWTQARRGGAGNYFTSFGHDLDGAFRIAPSNVILLKVNYWLSM